MVKSIRCSSVERSEYCRRPRDTTSGADVVRCLIHEEPIRAHLDALCPSPTALASSATEEKKKGGWKLLARGLQLDVRIAYIAHMLITAPDRRTMPRKRYNVFLAKPNCLNAGRGNSVLNEHSLSPPLPLVSCVSDGVQGSTIDKPGLTRCTVSSRLCEEAVEGGPAFRSGSFGEVATCSVMSCSRNASFSSLQRHNQLRTTSATKSPSYCERRSHREEHGWAA
ncbi:hypothetical protein MRB53_036854 [Persea americana]|nr:hypothetical protein MRB53_036854 [Persea americana]